LWCGKHFLERLLNIGFDVVDMLDAGADPHQVGIHTRADLLFGRQLFVRGGCRVNGQRFRIADICQVADQLQVVNKGTWRVPFPPFTPKFKIPPKPLGKYFFASSLYGIARQAGVLHKIYHLVRFQPLGQGQGILHMPVYPQRKRFQALQQ
jgi:hypothetical protein